MGEGLSKFCANEEIPLNELEVEAQHTARLDNSLPRIVQQTTDQATESLFSRVEQSFEDMTRKMIQKKLLEKCDSSLDHAVESLIDKSFGKMLQDLQTESKHNDRGKRLIPLKNPTKTEAAQQLKRWGLPNELIHRMDQEGWLDAKIWNSLTKDELTKLNFGSGHIATFMNGIRQKQQREEEQKKERAKRNKNAIIGQSDLLAEWGIPTKLIDKMKEFGWIHPQYFEDLLEKEHELELLGFKNGHISTFRRKFQAWKEDQATKPTERKVQLLRKLETAKNQQSSTLKRNIDVQNKTNEPLLVRIIGERKYGSFESNLLSSSEQIDQENRRVKDESVFSNNKLKHNVMTDQTSNQTQERNVSLGVQGAPVGGFAQIGADVGLSKKDKSLLQKTSKQGIETENSDQKISNNQNTNKMSESIISSTNNVSKHQWNKITAGFTHILPDQTIVFPVQISHPNAVVYMSIYAASKDRSICVCDNVQIDSNYIIIKKVRIDGYDELFTWQHAIKRPNIHQDAENYNIVNTEKLCNYFWKKHVPKNKADYIQKKLRNHQYDITNEKTMNQLTNHVTQISEIYDNLCNTDESKEKQHPSLSDLTKEFVELTSKLAKIKKEANYEKEDKYNNGEDSEDEQLELVSKFFDVDGYSLLKKWKLEQFYERMADEGWDSPLDWVHLDDFVMKQQLGFRPGHIQVFNRKLDLWIKKYNDVRRTIPPRRKGKDGILIVGPGEVKLLKSNHNYEFTKIIIRKGGKLTTFAWSPSHHGGGVLFIKSFQEVVLEEGAKISVSGKGYWGSKTPKYPGYSPTTKPKGGGQSSPSNCTGGAGGGGYGSKGGDGFCEYTENKYNEQEYEKKENNINMGYGAGGEMYGDKKLTALDCNYEQDFDEKCDAKEFAVKRHLEAIGSGGGCYGNVESRKRGGTGGGAVKVICEKLVMYKNALITANGYFDPNECKFSGGGSGGSIWVVVHKELVCKSNENNFWDKPLALEAQGGGNEHEKLMKLFKEDKTFGIGGRGRIRVDYHTPYDIKWDNFKPKEAVYIAEGVDHED